jgi:cytochrome b
MNKIVVWDFPIRVFHWAFSICLTLALIISLAVDHESPLFQYHMLLGLTAGFLLVIRLVIGLVGARYSRFRGLLFSPVETIGYLAKSLTGRARRYVGHNPGTAAIALLMFGLVAGLVWTGLNMTTEGSEEIHVLLAYVMLAAVLAHVLGMFLHARHHRENIFASMITGKKEGEKSAELPSTQRLAGMVTLLVCALWTALLFRGYDAGNSTVTIPGVGPVSLGEVESEQEQEGSRGEGEEHITENEDESDDD